ncbi:methyltransferase RsmF C-terminal domain-like protein [Parapedobacter indicus]|uniref:16S rRNA C967 or C1407 C5-methylase, RsmB/RsmF family n=1 Tax=Parapedobacter indicus TaxID=1477437 RepID=A0A1I3KFV8_9SPHI|nr:RNA methyltransferase [Parapedobacter indicus]PPL01805.1 16S rRNA C967 or C1407 C5-methylase (RsmB/RsmF family) [Parapedobacter indicus]SFI71178.1 16S rRNA C967 or C1407 C5-methylase, RsmB/RsmF family [Parapedobacter indicus]
MSNIVPPALVRRLGNLAGFDTDAFEAVHEQEGGITSIRVNPDKPQVSPPASGDPVPWCNTGYYLSERPVFTLDPLFHAGCYYVQEASSMFLAHAIRELMLDKQPLIALDLCAAPGGKSTLLNTYLHPDSLLIANELIKSRVTVLADNLVRWGHPNTVVTNNDPSAFARIPGYVDLMLVDAPCSGSGMFRKDHAAINQWSEGAVQLCSERQRRILADSLPTLKEGGVLLYSTCSYSVEENEEIADWLCETQGMEPVALSVNKAWGIEQTRSERHGCPGFRFYPHRLRGEGFFLAAFRKATVQPSFDRPKSKTERAVVPDKLENWIAHPEIFFSFTVGDDIHILPKGRENDLLILQKMLYLRNAGTRVGRMAKNDLIPAHDLALSLVRHSGIPSISLDEALAQEYLRKGTLPPSINADNDTGWVLATFNGASLGWMKLLPNRINNYYPKEWRILMVNG